MKFLNYILKGGAILANQVSPSYNSRFDSGVFTLGFIGFILLLIVVIILALTMEGEKIKTWFKPSTEFQKVWIGGCAGTRFGCCSDGTTTRLDQDGTNCIEKVIVGGCEESDFGCCEDGITAKADKSGKNCNKTEKL